MHPEYVGTLDGLIVFHLVGTVAIIFQEEDETDLLEYGIVLGFWLKDKKPVRFILVWYLSLVHLAFHINWNDLESFSLATISLLLLGAAIIPWKAFLEVFWLILYNLFSGLIQKTKIRRNSKKNGF